MSHKLTEQLEKARSRPVSIEERQAQRISFAYGNVAIENPLVTREMVIQAAAELDAEYGDRG
jgi:hypothetical protein